jgi:hypothetical protein
MASNLPSAEATEANSFLAKFTHYLTKTVKDKAIAELVELHARNALFLMLEECFLHVPTNFADANSKTECRASLTNFSSEEYREFLNEQLEQQEALSSFERAALQMLAALTTADTTKSFLSR